MAEHCDADVLIIGSGPVGLAAAIDLAKKGITTIVVEARAYLQPPEVKSNHVAARTMERFRRLGIADQVRDAGLPHDHPHDVAFRTTVTGTELSRVVLPSRNGRRAAHPIGADAWWPTPEPPHRINQTFLEPLLARHAATLPQVALLNETRFESLEQDDSGVTIVVTDATGGGARTLRGTFLLGADGSRSAVRKIIDATLQGDPVLMQVQSTCIRAPRLYELMEGERAWCYYTYNTRRNGHVFTVDGAGTFLIHNHLSGDEYATGTVDRDASIRDILGVDDDFEYEILSEEDWTARRLVVDKLREGRVFIAGDAAHLWVPYAGFGMNAGIADALNLTWLIGACLRGWAGIGILDAYEAERLPITEQVSRFAMSHQRKVSRDRIPAEIEERSSAGAEARLELGLYARQLNTQQFAAAGLNFGYNYDASPIIRYDGAASPVYTMDDFTESTVPGCRAPHFWMPDGRSVYDLFGDGYSLLCFADPSAASALIGAAEEVGMPLAVIDARGVDGTKPYAHAYVVAREDQHVAWRGDRIPSDARGLVAQLRGE
jgi:2-polyprenyl-6-methoxyphenol hydroxylase and related FAD-dependent oxidoreductases